MVKDSKKGWIVRISEQERITIIHLVGHAGFTMWHALKWHQRLSGQCNPSIKTLAEKCLMSESGVKKKLPQLEAAGLFIKIQGDKNNSNVYKLPLDKDGDLVGHIVARSQSDLRHKVDKGGSQSRQGVGHKVDTNKDKDNKDKVSKRDNAIAPPISSPKSWSPEPIELNGKTIVTKKGCKAIGRFQTDAIKANIEEWAKLNDQKRQLLGKYLIHRLKRPGKNKSPATSIALKKIIKRVQPMPITYLQKIVELSIEKNWLSLAKDEWAEREGIVNELKQKEKQVLSSDFEKKVHNA